MKVWSQNKSLKPTLKPVTPFAEMAKSAPRYGGLVPPFYSSIKLLKTIFQINTISIMQADRRGGVRFPGSCRASMVKNRFGLVGEYPSGCLAADNSTLRLNTSTKQCFSSPILVQTKVALKGGLHDCVWRKFQSMQLVSVYGN